jgi:hypothetical protein
MADSSKPVLFRHPEAANGTGVYHQLIAAQPTVMILGQIRDLESITELISS